MPDDPNRIWSLGADPGVSGNEKLTPLLSIVLGCSDFLVIS